MQKILSIHYTRFYVLAMSAGIASVNIFPTLPPLWLITAILGVLILLSVYRPNCWVGVWFMAGACWSSIYGHQGLAARLPESLAGQDVQVIGFVQEMPHSTEEGQRFIFTVESVLSHPSLPLRKLSLSTYNTSLIFHAAERWQLRARLKPPHGFKNRGGFDYEAWIFEQGIDATGYVKQAEKISVSADAWAQINVWREWLRDHVDRLIPTSLFKGIITALIIGDSYQISSDQWRVFNRTSTSHLIAIFYVLKHY